MFFSPPTETKQDRDALIKPLLDSDNDSTDSLVAMGKEETTGAKLASPVESKSANGKYNDYLAGRIYASNAPKIFLETITARTATFIIALTYIFFIVGFCIDFYTTYKSFNSSNYDLGARPCSEVDKTISSSRQYWSCSSGKFWNSTVTNLNNVISVKLDVQQTNVTAMLSNATDHFAITYNLDLWTCYNENGCGDTFASNDYYTNDPNTWQHVYVATEERLEVDVSTDVNSKGEVDEVTKSLIPSTFQNQESIPTNGLVKSYFLSVEYLDDPYNLFGSELGNASLSTIYQFDVVERPRQTAVNAVNIILLVVTLGVLVSYVVMLSRQKKVLSEQKWVVAYFVLLVMFQNPVYCVIVFYKSAPTVQAAYGSYVIGYLAQAGLFFLWLLFADSVTRKTTSKAYFYGPKAFIGFVIFLFSILILTFQFPGLSAHGGHYAHTRSAVEAVANWSPNLKNEFISFTIIYLLLIWVW